MEACRRLRKREVRQKEARRWGVPRGTVRPRLLPALLQQWRKHQDRRLYGTMYKGQTMCANTCQNLYQERFVGKKREERALLIALLPPLLFSNCKDESKTNLERLIFSERRRIVRALLLLMYPFA